MEIKGRLIAIVIAAFVIGAAVATIALLVMPKMGLLEMSLSEDDLNTMIATEYFGGHCERLGLESAVLVQETESGDTYGMPICTEPIS